MPVSKSVHRPLLHRFDISLFLGAPESQSLTQVVGFSFLGCSCRIKDTKAFKIDLNSTVTTPAPYFLVSILRLQEADEVVWVVGLQDVESLVHKPAPAFGRALEN